MDEVDCGLSNYTDDCKAWFSPVPQGSQGVPLATRCTKGLTSDENTYKCVCINIYIYAYLDIDVNLSIYQCVKLLVGWGSHFTRT